MDADAFHDLTAAYALDALDPEDARAYEAHLARCARCRAELAALNETAVELAYAADAPPPPPELRTRILDEAKRERSNVVPLRSRWLVPVAAAAAVAACVALALGIWASSLSHKLGRRTEALSAQQRITAILSDPNATTTASAHGQDGRLVVSPEGGAVLIVDRLAAAPSGHTYEAWVAAGGDPQPAGTFHGGGDNAVLLRTRVPRTATVLVTLEREGGVSAPTRQPLLSVQNSA